MNTARNWFPRSRSRVLLTAIALLLLLDLGRSLYARNAYRQPTEPWQPAPYQPIAWPPGSDMPPDAPLAERVYAERCAICHGPNGVGDGPAAPSMIPRPTNFTLGQFKYKSTPAGQPPTAADIAATIAKGLPASAMPYWGDVLSELEIGALVELVAGFSGLQLSSAEMAIDHQDQVRSSPESIARGADLFQSAGCAACHGPDGRARTRLPDQRGYPVDARDLTAPWTFRGGERTQDIYNRITTGMSPSPMPPFEETLTADQRWDLTNYVLSLARTPPWEPGGQLEGPGFSTDPVQRGRYLVHLEMCGLCHTQIEDQALIYSGDSYYLAGGMGIPAGPQGTFVSRNLTSDPETGLGKWTPEQIADAIRNGRGRDRNLNFWGMPWMILHSFEQEDALGIGHYLKTLPPVTNRIPPPLKHGFIESVISKTAASRFLPPLGNPDALVYRAGNFGQTDPGILGPGWLQPVLIGAQYLVLLWAVTGYYASSPGSVPPQGTRNWLKFAAAWSGIGFLGFLAWFMYSTPVLPFVPPEIVNLAVTVDIPQIEPADFDSPEDFSLAERGRYLFTVTSCAFCHGNQGEGGSKVNSPAFGTMWVRNISSDNETGIGSWSDAEIARAIRSGVSRDGQPLHWQGMTWDHLSNLDEEDLQAIIRFLRTLPPVENRIQKPHAPSENDCTDYTFFLVESFNSGCER